MRTVQLIIGLSMSALVNQSPLPIKEIHLCFWNASHLCDQATIQPGMPVLAGDMPAYQFLPNLSVWIFDFGEKIKTTCTPCSTVMPCHANSFILVIISKSNGNRTIARGNVPYMDSGFYGLIPGGLWHFCEGYSTQVLRLDTWSGGSVLPTVAVCLTSACGLLS